MQMPDMLVAVIIRTGKYAAKGEGSLDFGVHRDPVANARARFWATRGRVVYEGLS